MLSKPIKLKISTKLITGYISVIALFGLFSYVNDAEFQKKDIEEAIGREVDYAKASFENVKNRDTAMLSSALASIIQNEEIRNIYLEKDRDKLYTYNQELFKKLKESYGITHWYFILPDGRTFLRMHDKELSDDEIKRFTFQKARATGEFESGLELGKSAYALRVVAPYYNGTELIGYVELGEEIDHFLQIFKDRTDSDSTIIAEKKYMNQEDWASTRQITGLRNNWDDYSNKLLVSATGNSTVTEKCFSEANVNSVRGAKKIFPVIRESGRSFGCGGFKIADARGQDSGIVMVSVDISDHMAIVEKNNRNALIYLIAIFVLAILIGALFSHSISNSIKKLVEGTGIISRGDLSYRVNVETDDEIGQLGKEFNKMTEKLKHSYSQLEEMVSQRTQELEVAKTGLEVKVKERTKELEKAKASVEIQVQERTKKLQETIDELERMNKAMSNRELKMIELKEKMKALEKDTEKK